MEKVTTVTGVAVPLERTNVDTDQIIPAVFLKRVTKTGYDDALFFEWRKDPEFVLNRPEFARASGTSPSPSSVLVAGSDFGIGSSREHAVWALNDYGFRAVLSPKFGDIFRGNAGKQGLLAAQITEEAVEQIWARINAQPGIEITVNLIDRTVSIADLTVDFEIDDYTRWRLLEGLDDIGLTLRDEARITEFESSRETWRPRTLPPRHPTEVTT